MRSLDLVLHAITDDERARLAYTASQLREPDDWNAGTRGLWRFSYEGFNSLRHFVNALADCGGLQWTQGGGFDLLATFESGDGSFDGLTISAALHRGDIQRSFSPLITAFVDDVAAFLGEEPTVESAATAIRDALNETLAHFAAE